MISGGEVVYSGRSAGSMVATVSIELSGEVTPGFLEHFLQGDPKGELRVLGANIAFRPHYKDDAWADKVHEKNTSVEAVSRMGEPGSRTLFLPVKDVEGMLVRMRRPKGRPDTKVETFEAVVRRDTIIDEKEHILNFLPRSSVID